MNQRQTAFPNDPKQSQWLLWTGTYRFAACVALIVLAGIAANARVVFHLPLCAAAPERINPNTAPAASLVRLPGIGKARALDIIHYRQVNAKFEIVFESADDLQVIRGIGPKTAEKLEPWLIFEEEY